MSIPLPSISPDVATAQACCICGHSEGRTHRAREMMFGKGGEFLYFECGACGAMHLLNPPANMSEYYPPWYYSLVAEVDWNTPLTRGGFVNWLHRKRNAAAIFETRGFGHLLRRLRPFPPEATPSFRRLVDGCPVPSHRARIMDVGCGRGVLLSQLACIGFDRLTGIDPYIADSTTPARGVHLRKCDIRDLEEDRFDFVILNHSLEHMDDQVGVLRAIKRVLAPGGVCRIEVPVAGCAAWREYGTDWIELDAPRHLCLQTPQSMQMSAERAGLKVTRAESAGSAFEFWGSEMYRRGTPYYDDAQQAYREPSSIFTEAEMHRFDERVRDATARGESGRMIFWLRSLES